MRDFIVTGLDLSLASTGVARVLPAGAWAGRIRPGKRTGYDRIRYLAAEIAESIGGADLVVVEGPSYGSSNGQRGHHERAGLWWHITYRLWAADVPFAVVPPACLKRYATGRGNASKDEVLSAIIRRYPQVELDGNDQADALTLAAMGADHLGCPFGRPVPAAHRAALGKVTWPEPIGEP